MTSWIVQKPCLKNSTPQPSWATAFLGLAHLSLEVFSIFSPYLQ